MTHTQFVILYGGEPVTKFEDRAEALAEGARLAQSGGRYRVIEVPEGFITHPNQRTIAHWYGQLPVQPPDLKDAVRWTAEDDAAAFVEEFPGQDLQGEWDSEAWAAHSRAHVRGAVERPLTSEEETEAWELYRARLIERIAELNAADA